MSRIGRHPIELPANVQCEVNENNEVIVKGPKGELKQQFRKEVGIELEGTTLKVTRDSEQKEIRSLHGLTRALIANMVHGVTEGYSKQLEIVGVGYRAQLAGKNITMSLGFTHPVEIVAPEGIEFEVPDQNHIIVKGIDKQLVGQIAANIRGVKPPEPYKGKGIRYSNEHVVIKEGKSGM